MSVPVEPDALDEAARPYGSAAYVLTTDDDGRPRVTHTRVRVDGSRVTVSLGRTAMRNVEARPRVTVLWPAPTSDEMSLIADGIAQNPDVNDSQSSLSIVVSSAVLHRAAPADEPTG